MKRVYFFMLCCFISIAGNSQNLVLNSEFETWSKIDKPANWTNTQGCLKDSVFVLSGSYSCKQEATTTSRDLGQKFVVIPSTQYRFSFFYRTGTETTGNGCRVWCSWLDNSQTGITDPVIHSGFMKGDGWQKYEAAVTSPDNAGYFYLLVRTLPNSVTYWDDFIFEEDIVSSEKETTISNIKIYPNPAHNYLTISNLQQLQHIDIQNITGHTVFSEEFHGESETTIPVSGLKDGFYLIRIITNGKVITHRFIKD
jgi:Secretion system C-terminal sorting domain